MVNLGARLYSKKYKRASKCIWSIPGVLRFSSPVNVKKYLSMLSDKRFQLYVKARFFDISSDEELFSWVCSESKARNLHDLINVLNASLIATPSSLMARFEEGFKRKDFQSIYDISLNSSADFLFQYEGLTEYQRVLSSFIFDDTRFLSGVKITNSNEGAFRQGLQYRRGIKQSLNPKFDKVLNEGNLIGAVKLYYAYCQYVQSTADLDKSIANWRHFVSLFPDSIAARKNLLLLLCKADDQGLIFEFEYLVGLNEADERIVDNVYRSLNRINSVELLEKVNNLKKKSQYALKVTLEIYRKNDFMSELPDLEAQYIKAYGKDKWFLSFEAKKLIDHGLYSEAALAYKGIKGQSVYYGVSLLRNKQVNKAKKVFEKIPKANNGYLSAQKYLGDIAFYEYSDWLSAVKHYDIALAVKFDYQINLRMLKSKILSGMPFSSLDVSRVDREDKFYLRYTENLYLGKVTKAVSSVSQIFVDAGLKPLMYKKSSTFFDSISANSKAVVDGPLVSVIMTAYKACDTIDRAIESILSQNYKNIELIIVEDNSPDETYEYLKAKYATKVKLLRTEVNSGTYVAKNLGMSEAIGDFITFMDSDDWSHPERISMQVNQLLLDETKVACQTGHLRITNEGDVLFRKRGVNLDVPISLIIKREVLNKIGYFDSVRASGDSEYINRIKTVYGSDAILQIPAPCILARQAEDSLTTSGATALTWAGMPKVRIDYRRSFREWHREGQNLFVLLDSDSRVFSAPKEIAI